MPTTSKPARQRVRAFTIIEIMVVVGIIVLLIAILIPAVRAAKLNSKITATRAVLSSLRTALAAYYNDFNAYPDSHPANVGTGTYGATSNIIPPGRAPALLAQALMGYLPGTLDGAGPDSTQTAFATDPHFGFRTRKPISVGGTPTLMGNVYGPYASDDPTYFKVNDPLSPPAPPVDPTNPTQTHDRSFYDSFGNEILYFRSEITSSSPAPVKIFDAVAANDSIFYSDDNLKGPPPASVSNADPTVKTVDPPTGKKIADDDFYTLIAGQKASGAAVTNTMTSYGQPVLGRDSYLLLSAGPDGLYYTSDDILMSK